MGGGGTGADGFGGEVAAVGGGLVAEHEVLEPPGEEWEAARALEEEAGTPSVAPWRAASVGVKAAGPEDGEAVALSGGEVGRVVGEGCWEGGGGSGEGGVHWVEGA